MNPPHDVVVIGAGSNGLAAAARLAARGLRVVVVERLARVGGQAGTFEFAPGFSSTLRAFDTGWASPRLCRQLGVAPPQSGTPALSVSLAMGGGEIFPIAAEVNAAVEQLRRLDARDAERWPDFVASLHAQAGVLAKLCEIPAPSIDGDVADVWPLLGIARRVRFGKGGAALVPELLRTLPMPVSDLAADWFNHELVRAAISAGGVQGIRQGPRSGGTSLVLLHHLIGAASGSVRTRPYHAAGPDAFARALSDAAVASGVHIRTGARVATIEVANDAVTGVVLEGGEVVPCRAVISTADPVSTMAGMVDPVWLDPELVHTVRNIKLRGATAFVNYPLDGLDDRWSSGSVRDALAAVVSLTTSVNALESAYDAVKYRGLAEAPHVEVGIPTLRWPALAPARKHVLTARVQYVPEAGAEQVSALRDALASRTHAAIEAAFPGLLATARASQVLLPSDLEAQFGLAGGAMSHGELMLDQILFMRPVPQLAHYDTPIEGLYLGGAGSHPGPLILGGAGVMAANRLLGTVRSSLTG